MPRAARSSTSPPCSAAPARGARLVAELDAARARLAALPPPRARTALVVERGGYTQGPDSLAAALLAAAGLVPPPGSPRGYGGFMPLERLLMLRPDIVFLKDPPTRPEDQGALFLTHPALAGLFPPERRISLPTRYTMLRRRRSGGGPRLHGDRAGPLAVAARPATVLANRS
ncbi:MAG: hypothetical protein M5U07_23280 [Xanthobacteraceae bacterium]|nr:hypothetical protein [Xanthobacteraceae bacterium]